MYLTYIVIIEFQYNFVQTFDYYYLLPTYQQCLQYITTKLYRILIYFPSIATVIEINFLEIKNRMSDQIVHR